MSAFQTTRTTRGNCSYYFSSVCQENQRPEIRLCFFSNFMKFCSQFTLTFSPGIERVKRRKESYLGRKSAEKSVPEVAQSEREILVEEISKEFAHAQVGPASMDQQQPLQKSELRQRVVTRQHGLHPFLTTDTHSNVCR